MGFEREQPLNELECAGLCTAPRDVQDIPVTKSPVCAHERVDANCGNLCAI